MHRVTPHIRTTVDLNLTTDNAIGVATYWAKMLVSALNGNQFKNRLDK